MGQRAKKRPQVQPPRPDRRGRDRQDELAAARRRANATKVGFVAAVAVLFVGGMSFARNARRTIWRRSMAWLAPWQTMPLSV